jgi:DNA-binding NarL/FixJ family response regulator
MPRALTHGSEVERAGSVITVAAVELGHLLRIGLRSVLTDRADLCLLPDVLAFAALDSAITKHSIDTIVVPQEAVSGLARLRADYPDLGITVVLNREHSEVAEHAAALVAATCFSISATPSEVRAAIRLAPDHPHLRTGPLRDTVGPASTRPRVLTPRQEQVLALNLEGLTRSQISERLSISRHTVNAHFAAIFDKLRVSSQHELRHILPASQRDTATP